MLLVISIFIALLQNNKMKKTAILATVLLLFSCNVSDDNTSGNRNIYYKESPWPYSGHKSMFSISKNYENVNDYPNGGGTQAPDNEGIITLGLPGGWLTVEFDPPVENQKIENGSQYDFIVFGNAFWSGGPDNPQFEPGFVEVMEDTNNNGLQDDKWYLLLHPDNRNLVVKETITYFIEDFTTDTWPDTLSSPATFETWSTKPGFKYIGVSDYTPTLLLGDMSGAIGTNQDNRLDDPEDNINAKPADFYSVPDTPGDLVIDPGSGGGDAFDISWAVDTETLQPVNLGQVKWIKIISGKTQQSDQSTEVDSVIRVK